MHSKSPTQGGDVDISGEHCCWQQYNKSMRLPVPALPAAPYVIILLLLLDMFPRWGDSSELIIIFTQSVITVCNAITSRPPTANILVIPIACTIPETLFYTEILPGATAPISASPCGIQAKRKVKNLGEAVKWNIMLFRAIMSQIHILQAVQPNILCLCLCTS